MKVYAILAPLICLVVTAPVEEEHLKNDIADFLEILPIDKIKKIAIKHLHEDPEFQAAIMYMKSPEFSGMVHELQKYPEVIELKAYLKEAGIDLDEYNERFCGFFRDVNIEVDLKIRSLRGFIEEVKQIIPIAKLIEMFETKMRTSPAFKEFYQKITSEECHKLVAKVRALPLFRKVVAEITYMGIDIDRIFGILYAVIGWSDDQTLTTIIDALTTTASSK